MTATPNGEVHGVIIPVPVKLIESDPDKDLPSVQHYVWSQIIASARAGTLKKDTCRAAVNGTFFNHSQYPYELQGRVGIGSWPWSGKEIPKQRWAFGINLSEKKPFEKEQMQLTGSDNYDVPSSWKGRYPFGLSGIGCLVNDGKKILDPDTACKEFTKMDGRYARTLIAWTKDQKHFFMIWSKGDYFNFAGLTDPYDPYWGEGWTWIEARDFLLDYLPYLLDYPVIVSENWRPQKRFDIYQGLLLDGGSHSDIIYIRAWKDVPALTGTDEDIKRKLRQRYGVEVHDNESDGGIYRRGNRSAVQAYLVP